MVRCEAGVLGAHPGPPAARLTSAVAVGDGVDERVVIAPKLPKKVPVEIRPLSTAPDESRADGES